MTSEAEKKRAADDLSVIKELKTYRPFAGYYLRRLEEKIESHKRTVLDVATTPEQTTILKHVIEALKKDALQILDQDEAGCRSILSQ